MTLVSVPRVKNGKEGGGWGGQSSQQSDSNNQRETRDEPDVTLWREAHLGTDLYLPPVGT